MHDRKTTAKVFNILMTKSTDNTGDHEVLILFTDSSAWQVVKFMCYGF